MSRLSTLNRSVSGKVVFITGAANGMGRATAHLFADEGAKVAIADMNEERLRSVEKEIRDAGYEVRAWALDVTDGDAITRVIAEVAEHFGALDILVNNAGVSITSPIDEASYEDAWAMTLAVNLQAHTRCIRAALPHLTQNGEGRIINIASTEGLGATRSISAYTASKHGVVGLTRALAVELGSRDITVNCVCPGPIHTGMTEAIPDEMKTKFARRRVPKRRYGSPEEVAHMTLNLAMPASSFVTGAIIPVDGGLVVQNT